MTKNGDIIVKLAHPYTAILIDETCENIVIPSHFTIIKADRTRILPEYLYWFLNSDFSLKEYSKNNTSNMIGAIRPHFIGEIEINLPSIDTQKKIAEFYTLAKKEQLLLRKLEEEKSKYTKLQLEKLYMKGN